VLQGTDQLKNPVDAKEAEPATLLLVAQSLIQLRYPVSPVAEENGVEVAL
jgi:hypothetical protein